MKQKGDGGALTAAWGFNELGIDDLPDNWHFPFMLTLEQTAIVTSEHQLTIQVPSSVPPGEHRITVVIDTEATPAQRQLNLIPLRLDAAPDVRYRREDLYGDNGR